ncbi:O-antigen ligase family protein [Deinococcus pimensis]|uniref:O-antigen ligase family protein n=1 Tax=Deinococcus pimensis TaxID=309888 RepID=UPI0004868D95|nr:O-antigen ligase family protein [Deinococcus pimensis]
MEQPKFAAPLIGGLQNVYFVLLFVVHVLILDPFSIRAPLPPGVAPYMYGLYPKLVTLTATVAVGGLLLAGAFLRGWRPPRRHRGDLLWGSYGVLTLWVLAAALLRRDDPFLTFHGPVSRADGVAVQLLWFALAPLTYLVATVRRLDPRAALTALFVGGGINAAWMLVQSLGVEPMSLLNDAIRAAQPSGGLGNRGPASAYVGVLLTFLLLNSASPRPLLPVAARVPLLLLLGAALAAAPTRTTWLVLPALLLVWCAAQGLRSSWTPVRRVLPAAAVALLGFVLFVSLPASRDRTDLVTARTDGSLEYRLLAARVALRVVADEPAIGHGAGGFKTQFWTHATPEEAGAMLRLARVSKEGNSYSQLENGRRVYLALDQIGNDKVHNYLADYAVESGLPAALALVVFLVLALKRALDGSGTLAAQLAWALLVYFGCGLTWFAMPTVEPVVWALLGLTLALGRHAPSPALTPPARSEDLP